VIPPMKIFTSDSLLESLGAHPVSVSRLLTIVNII
jgi:hypothetical protein